MKNSMIIITLVINFPLSFDFVLFKSDENHNIFSLLNHLKSTAGTKVHIKFSKKLSLSHF